MEILRHSYYVYGVLTTRILRVSRLHDDLPSFLPHVHGDYKNWSDFLKFNFEERRCRRNKLSEAVAVADTYRYLRRTPFHHFQNHHQKKYPGMMKPNLTPIQCPVFARIALINVCSYVHRDATTLVLRQSRHHCVLSAFQVRLPNLDVCFEHA